MALSAILSCCSWSNVQIMIIVLLFGNEGFLSAISQRSASLRLRIPDSLFDSGRGARVLPRLDDPTPAAMLTLDFVG
jgi:hypothetical protein